MTWIVLSILIGLAHINAVHAVLRYDTDDDEGIGAIVLLILAIIVFLISGILFIYIVYKLWNGRFGRRYYSRSDKELIIYRNSQQYDEKDGSRYSSLTTVQARASSVNPSVTEESVKQEEEIAIVETGVPITGIVTEEAIVTNAPTTSQAELETQELVIVFDNNDDVVEVFTHVT